ncbi:MAG TPA: NHLP bacteriocin export ABC transporter permease/ATPase subunit [Opitutaceae bacterium]
MSAEALTALFLREGALEVVGGNTPFLLSDPSAVWFVESGDVEVFSVSVVDGEPSGARSHFFSVPAGQLLIGIAPLGEELSRGLLAVGLVGTRLRRLPFSRLHALARDPAYTAALARLLDGWVGGLSAGAARDVVPRTQLLIEATQRQDIEGNYRFRCQRGVLWLMPISGNLLFIGLEEISPTDPPSLFPVTPDSWLQAMGPCVIAANETAEVIAYPEFWTGLLRFSHLILVCETANRRFADVDEHNRAKDRLVAGQRVATKALADLVGVLEETSSAFDSPVDDPHFLACHAIAAHRGIALHPPVELLKGEPLPDPVAAIARASRIRRRQVGLETGWWTRDHGPILAWLAAGHHPVALLPICNNAYELHDPRTRTRIAVTAEVAATLEPFGEVLYRSFRDDAVTGWELLRFGARGLRRDVLLVLALGTAGGLLSTLPAIAVGRVFDTIVPDASESQLLHVTLGLALLALAVAIFQVTRGLALLRIESRLDHDIQAATIDRLLKLPLAFFRGHTAGDLAQRANGINEIRQVASATLVTAVLGNLFGVFNLLLLFYYHAGLAVVACLLIALALAITLALGGLQLRHQRVLAERRGKLEGMVLQFLTGISKLRVAGAELLAFSSWARHFARQRQSAFAAHRCAHRVSIFNALYPILVTAVLFWLVAQRWGGALSVGEFLAFLTAFTAFLTAMLAMTHGLVAALNIVPLFERVRPILAAAPEIEVAKPDPGTLSGRVEITRVSFRYSPDSPPVLQDVSLEARPGEFIAIVGPSGSGKSTLMRLLLGFDRPASGAIHYDGKDLAEIDVAGVRRQIGVVLQSSKPMPGELLTNIIGTQPLTETDAWEAAALAGLEEDIRALPMGMHTMLPAGCGVLSGGQQQRLMIARAVAAKPHILLFDEATSALDNRTQAVVSESLERLQATRIVIAHRLSTIVRADRIYVVDGGRIVQTGTYAELMSQPGLFRELAVRPLTDTTKAVLF